MNKQEQLEKRALAIELRHQGLSCSEIAKELHIAKSTASTYVKGIPLPENLLEIKYTKGREKSKLATMKRIQLINGTRRNIALPNSSRVNIGLIGEEYAKYRLLRSGLEIYQPQVLTPGCDIVVKSPSGKFYTCEVKSSRTDIVSFSRNKYNNQAHKWERGDYSSFNIDIFIAVLLSEEKIFIIPKEAYSISKSFHPTNIENNQWLDRFDLFV